MSSPARHHPCFGGLLERLGYVQCGFCTTILLVSVPSAGGGSLQQLRTVAVQCGSCAGILSVALPPPPASVELPLQEPGVDPPPRDSDESSGEDRGVEILVADNNNVFPAVNKPPVRRQRTPSAYNCFIKCVSEFCNMGRSVIREEIRRIKARDPNITHKEAFSAASKNHGLTYLESSRRETEASAAARQFLHVQAAKRGKKILWERKSGNDVDRFRKHQVTHVVASELTIMGFDFTHHRNVVPELIIM
ncbi:hypothetical protein ACP70R_004585 [Stipagrostis hirtigluma subsp. patula]